jgi:DNA-binding response OmpR family regulator
MQTTLERPPKILFIDDDVDALRAFERVARIEAWDVVTAPSAREATSLVDDHAIDVVAVDQWLPGLPGLDLLAQLRVSRPNVVRVLMATVRSRDLLRRAVMEGGVHAVVAKPWRLPVLANTIRQAAALARSLKIAASPDIAAAARVFSKIGA